MWELAWVYHVYQTYHDSCQRLTYHSLLQRSQIDTEGQSLIAYSLMVLYIVDQMWLMEAIRNNASR